MAKIKIDLSNKKLKNYLERFKKVNNVNLVFLSRLNQCRDSELLKEFRKVFKRQYVQDELAVQEIRDILSKYSYCFTYNDLGVVVKISTSLSKRENIKLASVDPRFNLIRCFVELFNNEIERVNLKRIRVCSNEKCQEIFLSLNGSEFCPKYTIYNLDKEGVNIYSCQIDSKNNNREEMKNKKTNTLKPKAKKIF